MTFIDEDIEEEIVCEVQGISSPEHKDDVFSYIIARGKDEWRVRPSEIWPLPA